MMLWRLIPSKTAIYALLTALGAALMAWHRRDARGDQRRDAQIKDFEHAEDIADAVTRNRADPERLRSFENAGYRD